jgi:hypothetical protein
MFVHARSDGVPMPLKHLADHRVCCFWYLSSFRSEGILDIPSQPGQSKHIRMELHHRLPIQDGHPSVLL